MFFLCAYLNIYYVNDSVRYIVGVRELSSPRLVQSVS